MITLTFILVASYIGFGFWFIGKVCDRYCPLSIGMPTLFTVLWVLLPLTLWHDFVK